MNCMSEDEHIALLTRYPRPGKVKTRLVPALGEEGAARLHRHLVAATLARLEKLRRDRSVQLTIWHDGATPEEMALWLGDRYPLRRQPAGDLGERLGTAVQAALAAGARRLLLVGSDCPGLDPPLLAEALERLRHADVVLGPAYDGGYYLLGLDSRVPAPSWQRLFSAIDWGSDLVLRQTLAAAAAEGLDTVVLPKRHDIDRPEDLQHLDHYPDPQ